VPNTCPLFCRCALTRALLGLDDVISMDVLFYRRDAEKGWVFNPGEPGCTADTAAGGIGGIRELYAREGSSEKSVSKDNLRLLPVILLALESFVYF
jgi:glutathionyl-hydroquinone reductase